MYLHLSGHSKRRNKCARKNAAHAAKNRRRVQRMRGKKLGTRLKAKH